MTGAAQDWVECGLPYGGVYADNPFRELDSFRKRELNQPGTLIELENGEQYLIGDINPILGVCDDCTDFAPECIVKRYRVVWTHDGN